MAPSKSVTAIFLRQIWNRRKFMKNTTGWRIATVRGIDLRIDYSLIILFLYIIFMASVYFPIVATRAGIDFSALRYGPFVWGIIFAITLLCSIVLHELGHALTAQAAGVKVKSIT